MRGTARHSRSRTRGRPRRGATIALGGAITALALLLGGCAAESPGAAPVFATEPEGSSDAAVTAACWRVANALSLATNAQAGVESGRWMPAEADGAYRAAARILDYIPVPTGSPVALPLIALQDLVEAPPAQAIGLDPADPVWGSTVERVLAACEAEGVEVTVDEWVTT